MPQIEFISVGVTVSTDDGSRQAYTNPLGVKTFAEAIAYLKKIETLLHLNTPPEKPLSPEMQEQLHNGEIDDRMGYAVERGSIEQEEAMNMSYAEKEDWLAKHDHDVDPY